MKSNVNHNKLYITIIGILAVALIGTAMWGLQKTSQDSVAQNNVATVGTAEDIQAQLDEHGIEPLDTSEASNKSSTTEELLYLIEEEKLAHDVYQTLYEKWGSRVFSNIMESEARHQNLVYAVLDSRGITDPRTGTVGTFVNADLQELYNSLIARGMESQSEAYKVGVLIEETDIADIQKTLSTLDPKDTDVKDVLENLMKGSENHLRAFTRQANR